MATVSVSKAVGCKCDRCWKIVKEYKTLNNGDHLCLRCFNVLKDDFPQFLECGVKEE